MNCKPGDLAIVIRSWHAPAVGGLCEVLGKSRGGCWFIRPFFPVPPAPSYESPDSNLRPIRDNPGNEHWVTEARNKLKGKTEITERGELA